MGTKEGKGASKGLKTTGIVLGAIAITAFWFWNDAQHTEELYLIGGTRDAPLVVSKHHESSGGDSRSGSSSWYVSSIWVPGQDDPVGELKTTANPLRLGLAGERFWIGAGQTPVLAARSGAVSLNGDDLEAMAPFADGYRLDRPAHAGFDGPIHEESGAVALRAGNGLVHVVMPDGERVPWDDFVAAHPPPEQRRCTGGTRRVCQTLGCVGIDPDPAGGGRVVLNGQRIGESLYGPELASGACLRSDDGGVAFVVAHRSLPGGGRDARPDAWSAYGLEGSHLWTKRADELFAGEERKRTMADVVDGVLVVAAAVKDFLHGTRVQVRVVQANGLTR